MEKEKLSIENPKLSKAEVRFLELRKNLSSGKLKKTQELDEYTKIYLDMMLFHVSSLKIDFSKYVNKQ